jgi:hypothetical protein
MQMLGMIPKRERRNKRDRDKERADHASIADGNKGMSLQDRLKTKFNLTQKDERANTTTSTISDDPYAFPDEPAPPPTKVIISAPTPPAVTEMAAPSPVAVRSPVAIGNKSPVSARSPGGISRQTSLPGGKSPGGMRCQQSSIPGGKSPVHGRPPEHVSAAKLYPELAEKLHMERSKSRLESKSKFGPRSSRTVNQLETKIAQNKIKMKKNQDVGLGHHGDLENHSASSSPKIQPSMFSPLPRSNSLQFPIDTNAHLSVLNQMRLTLGGYLSQPPPYSSMMTNSSHVPISRVPLHPHPYLHSYPTTPRNPTIKKEAKPEGIKDFQLPAYSQLDPDQNFTKVRLRKPREVIAEKKARVKLKCDSSVQVYGYYAKRQLYNSDLVPDGMILSFLTPP